MTADALCIWVIFAYPDDFPDHYVVRRQYVGPAGIAHAAIGGLYDSLEEARDDIPDGLVCMMPMPGDVPTIVETWL